MEHSERALKDIKKLESFLKKFKSLRLNEKYPSIFDHCLNYFKDSKHYFEKKDYFSSLGCSNYAYGMLESLLFLEKGKYFHELE
ncbi:MAG: DUF357 domain-containing protein [Candidatus ainarchaeum sp.]|nr:DUF357 domain-containing protein [Candidatus ainarchaeum sp.]